MMGIRVVGDIMISIIISDNVVVEMREEVIIEDHNMQLKIIDHKKQTIHPHTPVV